MAGFGDFLERVNRGVGWPLLQCILVSVWHAAALLRWVTRWSVAKIFNALDRR